MRSHENSSENLKQRMHTCFECGRGANGWDSEVLVEGLGEGLREDGGRYQGRTVCRPDNRRSHEAARHRPLYVFSTLSLRSFLIFPYSYRESLLRTALRRLLPPRPARVQIEERHAGKPRHDNANDHEDSAARGRSDGVQDELGGSRRSVVCWYRWAGRTGPGVARGALLYFALWICKY